MVTFFLLLELVPSATGNWYELYDRGDATDIRGKPEAMLMGKRMPREHRCRQLTKLCGLILVVARETGIGVGEVRLNVCSCGLFIYVFEKQNKTVRSLGDTCTRVDRSRQHKKKRIPMNRGWRYM